MRIFARNVCILLALIANGWLSAQTSQIVPVNLAPTPPMGWANWNRYFCDYDDAVIRSQADTLVKTGMRDLGYKYLIIQECIAPARDSNGTVVVDAKRFPQGIKPLVEYIHSLGLKAGIYTDVGEHTCYDNPLYEGSFNHEDEDAATFASWGIDLIEVDYCNLPARHTGKELYERMAVAIRKTGRPMLLYICSWGNERPWEWAQGVAQLWRTDADLTWKKNDVQWTRVVQNFLSNARHAVFSAPNGWNDPDMLAVGNSGLSNVEARSHFSMWAISAAPLWSGTDLSQLTKENLATYTNPDVIAVDQDALGAGPVKIREDADGLQVWDKPLENVGGDSHAVLLLNLTSSTATLNVRWSDLGLLSDAKVRDLWVRKDLGAFKEGYTESVPAHGSIMLKVMGKSDPAKGAVYEAEWPGNVKQAGAELFECVECSSGYGVAISGGGGQVNESISFPKVTVLHEGTYNLRVFFVRNARNRKTITIQIGQANPVELKIRALAWGWEDIHVPLKSGVNAVTIRYAGEDRFHLDCIQVLAESR